MCLEQLKWVFRKYRVRLNGTFLVPYFFGRVLLHIDEKKLTAINFILEFNKKKMAYTTLY